MKNVIFFLLSMLVMHTANAQCAAGTITGLKKVQVADTVRLRDTARGGRWSVSDSTIAVIDTNGLVRGKMRGKVYVTYRLSGACSSAFTTDSVTVISGFIGNRRICVGDTTRYRDTIAVGRWSSSDTNKVTINDTSGFITAIDTGYVILSYRFIRFGRSYVASDTFRIQFTPNIIGSVSATTVCSNATTVMRNSGNSVIWRSLSPSLLATSTIDTSNVSLRPRSYGVATILYTSSWCNFAYDTAVVTIFPSPRAGFIWPRDPVLCAPYVDTFLFTGDTGGVWTSSVPSLASIDSRTGAFTYSSLSYATISYRVTNIYGCSERASSYIRPDIAYVGGISGPATIAVGTTAGYSSSSFGWYSRWSVYPVTGVISDFRYRCNFAATTVGTASLAIYVSTPCDSGLAALSVTVVPPAIGASSSYFTGYINNNCTSPEFGVSVVAHSTAYTLRTYYGDGTTDTRTISPSSEAALTNYNHAYGTSGTYTIRQVLLNGTTVLDSVYFSYNHKACHNVNLSYYYDVDSNCRRSGTEHFLSGPNKVVVDSNGTIVDTISITSGFYYQALGATGDIYGFRLVSSRFGFSCLSSGILYDTLSASTDGEVRREIGVVSSGSGFDLIPFSSARTGRHHQAFSLFVGNDYRTAADGTLTLNHSPLYDFQSARPTPTSISGSSVSWSLTSISAFTGSQPYISVDFEVPGTWLMPGDTTRSNIVITSTTGTDLDTNNNNHWRVDTVKSSYDPNMVSVVPEGNIYNGTQLTYTIDFENQGNDTARNIHVMDTLSNNLDVSSLEILMATATMFTEVIHAGGRTILKFDFPGINLPDSSHHNQCTGMLKYKIKANRGQPDGNLIPARVGIYFDDNEVVMTGTVTNTVIIPYDSVVSVLGDTSCTGDSAWFYARVHTVANSHYQWYLNSRAVGRDTTAYFTDSLRSGDLIKCQMTGIMDDTIVTMSNVVRMNVYPHPILSSIVGPTWICDTATITLTNSMAGGVWRVSNPNARYLSGGRFKGVTTGLDTVFYVITNFCGTDTVMYPIAISPILNTLVTIAVAPGDSLCSGAPVTFTPSPVAGGAAPFYQWKKFGTVVDTGATFTYLPSLSDNITCEMTSDENCPNPLRVTSNNIIMEVIPSVTPAVAITATPADSVRYPGQPVNFIASPSYGGTGITYQWFVNSNAVVGATNLIYTTNVYTNDTVWCAITSNVPCGADSAAVSAPIIIYADYLSIDGNNRSLSNFNIIPNPSSGDFTIVGSSAQKGVYAIELRDASGVLLYHNVVEKTTESFNYQVNIHDRLTAGLYYLRISGNNGHLVKIIMVD